MARVLLVNYDNDDLIGHFPMGLAYLASYLDDVEVYDQHVHHYPDEHLTRYLDTHDFDIVGMGASGGYYQYQKFLSISKAVRASKKDHLYVIGGHGPSPEPEYFLEKTKADVCVVGEGETVFRDIVAGTIRPRVSVPSAIEDVNMIKWPRWTLFNMEHYRLLRRPRAENGDFVAKVLSGRGCPFKCKFCYQMGAFRPRSAESIAAEVEQLISAYGITYIDFPDDLLMSSVKRVHEICKAMKPFGVKWSCSGRLNYAKPDVMRLMAESGCVFCNFGIESVDDLVLKGMNKALTVKQIDAGVQATLDAGISPGLNIIYGNPGDNRRMLGKGVDFLLRYDDGAQLRTVKPVTPYPGCAYYREMVEDGRIKGPADFYENLHVNSDLVSVLPNGMSADQAHRDLKWANKQLLRNYYYRAGEGAVDVMNDLYEGRSEEFRGWRRA